MQGQARRKTRQQGQTGRHIWFRRTHPPKILLHFYRFHVEVSDALQSPEPPTKEKAKSWMRLPSTNNRPSDSVGGIPSCKLCLPVARYYHSLRVTSVCYCFSLPPCNLCLLLLLPEVTDKLYQGLLLSLHPDHAIPMVAVMVLLSCRRCCFRRQIHRCFGSRQSNQPTRRRRWESRQRQQHQQQR
jgi:hypothetical protein